jgi:hypothetical protein
MSKHRILAARRDGRKGNFASSRNGLLSHLPAIPGRANVAGARPLVTSDVPRKARVESRSSRVKSRNRRLIRDHFDVGHAMNQPDAPAL